MQNILVVDPDEHSRLMMEVSLKQEKINVFTVKNSSEAFEVLKDKSIDLILTEVIFENEAPFYFAENLKVDPDYSTIPLVFITKAREVDYKIKGLELSADDYLTKPIFIREFVYRIKSHLKRQQVDILKPGGLSNNRQGFLSSDLVHDILRSVTENKREGRLYLENRKFKGRITFKGGYILNATLAKLSGIDAVLRMMFFDKGRFKIQFIEVSEEDTGAVCEKSEEVYIQLLMVKRCFAALKEKDERFKKVSLSALLDLSDNGPPPNSVDILKWFSKEAADKNVILPDDSKMQYLLSLAKRFRT